MDLNGKVNERGGNHLKIKDRDTVKIAISDQHMRTKEGKKGGIVQIYSKKG